jgi:hypothetical protein
MDVVAYRINKYFIDKKVSIYEMNLKGNIYTIILLDKKYKHFNNSIIITRNTMFEFNNKVVPDNQITKTFVLTKNLIELLESNCALAISLMISEYALE